MAKTASIIVNHLGEEIELGGGTVTSVDGVLPDTNKNVPLTVTQTKQELQDSVNNGTAVPGQFIITSDEQSSQQYTYFYPDMSSSATSRAPFSGPSGNYVATWVATEDCFVYCYFSVTGYLNGSLSVNGFQLATINTHDDNTSYINNFTTPCYFVKVGQTVTARSYTANVSGGISSRSIANDVGIITQSNELLSVKTNQYSLDEQFTGEYWVDGRPIYSKSYVDLPWNVTSAVGTNTFKIDDLSRFGRVITAFPSVYVPSDNRSYILPNIGASGNIIFYYRDFVNDSINVDYRKVVATVAQTFLVSCYLEYCKEN